MNGQKNQNSFQGAPDEKSTGGEKETNAAIAGNAGGAFETPSGNASKTRGKSQFGENANTERRRARRKRERNESIESQKDAQRARIVAAADALRNSASLV
jgi:hypothetical protein